MLTSNFQFIYIFSKFKTTKNWTELDGRSTIAEERLILRQYFMIHVITVILFWAEYTIRDLIHSSSIRSTMITEMKTHRHDFLTSIFIARTIEHKFKGNISHTPLIQSNTAGENVAREKIYRHLSANNNRHDGKARNETDPPAERHKSWQRESR